FTKAFSARPLENALRKSRSRLSFQRGMTMTLFARYHLPKEFDFMMRISSSLAGLVLVLSACGERSDQSSLFVAGGGAVAALQSVVDGASGSDGSPTATGGNSASGSAAAVVIRVAMEDRLWGGRSDAETAIRMRAPGAAVEPQRAAAGWEREGLLQQVDRDVE